MLNLDGSASNKRSLQTSSSLIVNGPIGFQEQETLASKRSLQSCRSGSRSYETENEVKADAQENQLPFVFHFLF